jgi:hypothetical protein
MEPHSFLNRRKIIMTNRREFMVQVSLASGMLATSTAWAQGAMVAETDAAAAGLGYKADATKPDAAKFPKYAKGQQCGNCALYTGKAGDAAGPCPLFAGKQVSSKGWCSAYAKKA